MSDVLVHAGGGLGNQLFEYAMGLVLARKTGGTCRVDPVACAIAGARPYVLGRLRAPAPAASLWESRLLLANRTRWQRHLWQKLAGRCHTGGSARLGRLRLVWESRRGFNADQLFPAARILYLVGVWQSHLYWRGYEGVVREAVELPAIPDSLSALARELQAGDSVAVHVRRTDYTHQAHKFVNCSLGYYSSAVRLAAATVRRPAYVVFSDDIAWCRANMQFPGPARYIDAPGQDPIVDLKLMSLCRHHIISNSTFGWWGAWLSAGAGLTVCPRRWYAQDDGVTGLYPDHWAAIDA